MKSQDARGKDLYAIHFPLKSKDSFNRIGTCFSASGLDSRNRFLCAVSALTAVGRSEDLAFFIEWALVEKVGPGEIYEIILQSYLFAGYPAAIEGFFILREILEKLGIDLDADLDLVKRGDWEKRGVELCQQVYGDNYILLRENMRRLSPELEGWMIEEGYGKVLSRPQLGQTARELATVAALTALGRERQLESHIRGSLNVGAGLTEVKQVISQTALFADTTRIEKAWRLLNRFPSE